MLLRLNLVIAIIAALAVGVLNFVMVKQKIETVEAHRKAEEDAKFDGIFVLRTNTDLGPLDAMLCYKRLWMVERGKR